MIRLLPGWRLWWGLVLCAALTGCGFHFRGNVQLPFDSVYVMTGDYNSFSADLKRFLTSGGRTKVVEHQQDAQVILEVLSEAQTKRILSLSAGGKVREYELHYTVRFRLSGQDKREWIAPVELSLRRDYSFDDRTQLAKENEEGGLVREMKSDALKMLLRRLEKAQPPRAA